MRFYSYDAAAKAIGVSRSDINNAISRKGVIGERSGAIKAALTEGDVAALVMFFETKAFYENLPARVAQVLTSLRAEDQP